jgi:hypothetical protein
MIMHHLPSFQATFPSVRKGYHAHPLPISFIETMEALGMVTASG